MKDAKVVCAQAADIKNQERNGGLLKPCPPTFSGTFAAFFKKHAAPNLPGVARVRAFDALLRRHLAAKDPVHVTRLVRGQTRGEICAGAGGRMLPTDNSPVWWIHSFLLSDEALPKDAATFFESLPYRMFGLPKREYLNSAEYHAAHIVNAKDGNVEWRRVVAVRNWSAEPLSTSIPAICSSPPKRVGRTVGRRRGHSLLGCLQVSGGLRGDNGRVPRRCRRGHSDSGDAAQPSLQLRRTRENKAPSRVSDGRASAGRPP